MGARLINHLSECGLTVRTGSNGLIVEPRKLITDPLRLFIREHKAEIMAELLAANDEYRLESKATPEPGPVHCITCQHYRFGRDHMGSMARCMVAGGFRGAVIERPERRRECGNYVLYDPSSPY